MNFWTPNWDSWGAGRDDSTMPWFTRYDYVEAYDYDVDTDSFTLRFRDDFDTLNTDIWRVSDYWTFEENSSIFVVPHVYTYQGNLVLKINKSIDDPFVPPAEDETSETDNGTETEGGSQTNGTNGSDGGSSTDGTNDGN